MRVILDLNVFDPAALHGAALKSFGNAEDAEGRFGTPAEPNVANCLVELLCEHTPVDAGFELIKWRDGR